MICSGTRYTEEGRLEEPERIWYKIRVLLLLPCKDLTSKLQNYRPNVTVYIKVLLAKLKLTHNLRI